MERVGACNEFGLDAARKAGDRRAEHTRCAIWSTSTCIRDDLTSPWRRLIVAWRFAELGDQLGTAYALLERGNVYISRDQYSDAVADFNQCVSLFHKLQDERAEAAALCDLGAMHRLQGRFDDAIACLTQALTVLQQYGAHLAAALTLRWLGLAYFDGGRLNDAVTCIEQDLAIFRQFGGHGEARSLSRLGGCISTLIVSMTPFAASPTA